jgi:hypothetical protein
MALALIFTRFRNSTTNCEKTRSRKYFHGGAKRRFIQQRKKIDMKAANQDNGAEPDVLVPARLGIGSWTILIVLLLVLAGTLVIAYLGWTLANGTDVPASGYVAMAFGALVSLGVGFGLMALIFYSSRKGYDEPPVLISPDGGGNESEAVSESKK